MSKRLMIQAKRVLRAEDADKPDLAEITEAINDYEDTVKGAEQFASAAGGAKIGSFFMSNAKSFLATAKFLMRRIRDHVPYATGDKMMLQRRLGLDGRGLAAAALARLQSAGRGLQSRGEDLGCRLMSTPGAAPGGSAKRSSHSINNSVSW